MDDTSLQVPLVLASRYAIERELGRGGMAIVYLARDLRHGRDVAVKCFRAENALPDGASRFLHEIQIAARLSHPNILALHDSGESDGLLYYVMPYVPGENLRERLAREGALPVVEALTIALQVAEALAYAHSHGVIHRDIKPENILFQGGQAVVSDFGIARAISAGGWDEEQLGAVPPGTPAYMSPEQLAGGARLDGRSDIYSLGCVFFEMLTGEPPFRGNTPEELVIQHHAETPPPLAARRPLLPRELRKVTATAMARLPADRYQTARQVADALQGVLRGSGDGSHGGGLLARRQFWIQRVAPGVAAVALLWALVVGFLEPRVDPSLYFVGPFATPGGPVPEGFRGGQSARLLHEALARWTDIELVAPQWGNDQLARVGEAPELADLSGIARRAHAGRLVTGEVWSLGDSVRVRAALYDTRGVSYSLREWTVTVPATLRGADAAFAELADSLLLPHPRSPYASGGTLGTRSLAAWEAYDAGHVALAEWDLEEADRQFEASLALDPDYALAHLWLAQTRNWAGEPADRWGDHVLDALRARLPLAPRDREWALALAALGAGRFAEACDRYDAIIRQDTLDFRGWYGRGECRRRDRIVVRDPRSPTGYRFRSSWEGAIQDYRKGLSLVPSAHRAFRGTGFERLTALFFAESNILRRGVVSDSTAFDFAGRMKLDHDTIAFVPRPVGALTEVGEGVFSPTLQAAVRRNRRLLLDLTGEWIRVFPRNPGALANRAKALELTGEFGGAESSKDPALQLYRQARLVTTSPAERTELAASEVRILVKRGDYASAGLLADSLLAAVDRAGQVEGGVLAPLAVFTGRASLAARLARLAAPAEFFWGSGGRRLSVPLELRETALALEVFATLGGPGDSVHALGREAQRQLHTLLPERERGEVAAALFDRSVSLFYPGQLDRPAGGAVPSADYLLNLKQLLHSGVDGAGAQVERTLDSLRAWRGQRGPFEVPEATLVESQLDLATGDTADAVAGLDRLLGGLGNQNSDLVNRVPSAGALVRAMIFRARLAAARGDFATARKYAAPVTVLWRHADPELQGEVRQMEALLH